MKTEAQYGQGTGTSEYVSVKTRTLERLATAFSCTPIMAQQQADALVNILLDLLDHHAEDWPEVITGYLSVKTIAQRLDVSVRRVQALVAEGRFPGHVRVGRTILVPESSFAAFERLSSGVHRSSR